MSLGAGCIRLSLGEGTSAGEAAGIARHEALHLLLATSRRGGERWIDPELAFADWIVRGIEGFADPRVPGFQTPLPRMLDPVPATRLEVHKRLGTLSSSPQSARRYFGERLFDELTRIASESVADQKATEERQLWLVEAAIGTHYLEAAGNLPVEEADALRPIVLDDWLLDYEQYSGAGSRGADRGRRRCRACPRGFPGMERRRRSPAVRCGRPRSLDSSRPSSAASRHPRRCASRAVLDTARVRDALARNRSARGAGARVAPCDPRCVVPGRPRRRKAFRANQRSARAARPAVSRRRLACIAGAAALGTGSAWPRRRGDPGRGAHDSRFPPAFGDCDRDGGVPRSASNRPFASRRARLKRTA